MKKNNALAPRYAFFRALTPLRFLLSICLLLLVAPASSARAYSVLSHEEVIDLTWDKQISPLLMAKYPQTTPDQLTKARAGDFFGFPQGLGLEPEANPPALQFAAWLRQPSTAKSTVEAIGRLVQGTALDGVPALAEELRNEKMEVKI